MSAGIIKKLERYTFFSFPHVEILQWLFIHYIENASTMPPIFLWVGGDNPIQLCRDAPVLVTKDTQRQ